MGLSPARVSDEKYKALRKLEKYLADRAEGLDLPVGRVANATEGGSRQVG
jgi:hypothetical protein